MFLKDASVAGFKIGSDVKGTGECYVVVPLEALGRSDLPAVLQELGAEAEEAGADELCQLVGEGFYDGKNRRDIREIIEILTDFAGTEDARARLQAVLRDRDVRDFTRRAAARYNGEGGL